MLSTIKGFQKALIGKKKNECFRLYIHPEYGYIDSFPDPIEDSFLIVDVQILDFSKMQ